MALSDGYEGSRGRDILLGVIIGALLSSVAWLASWSVSSQDATANPPRGAAAALAGREPTRDERSSSPCREVFVAQTAPLRAAEPALSQWQVHIGAMNQLIAGTITLDQAQRFWDQTRLGALRRLERYDRARARYGQRTVRCPQPADSSDSSEARACTRWGRAPGRFAWPR
jgi:hypothetical protein